MSLLKENIKNKLLVCYTKNKIKRRERQITKNHSWIKTRHLSKVVRTHCSVLLNSLFSENYGYSFREKKFIVDKILNYSFERGSNLLNTNAEMKKIKPLLQMNSFIMYDEIIKGLDEKRSKRSIDFNIDKELTYAQEMIESEGSVEKILKATISA